VQAVDWFTFRSGFPSGHPLLLLHGFLGSGADWLDVMDDLATNCYAVAPDLHGHGRTWTDLEKLDFDGLAGDLATLAAEEFDRPPIIAGYSMGGRIALYTALQHPEYFSGLVLESATAGIEKGQERRLRLTRDRDTARLLRNTGIKSFLLGWYKQSVFSSLTPKQIENLATSRSDNDAATAAFVLERLSQGRQPSLWPRLGELKLPTLLLAGDRDKKYGALAARMASAIPDCRLSIISEAGHITHMENKREFVGVLKKFLNECSG
jgi:2-succinyl-6-hydroxy-2,4-cyclohexadiene-1-carboxylate synthase